MCRAVKPVAQACALNRRAAKKRIRRGPAVIRSLTIQQTATEQSRIGNRAKLNLPARLTWRDASGTLRFVSVVTRDVSEVDAFVECQVPASIPLYRLVHLQLERPTQDVEVPSALRDGKVLSAVYRVGPYKTSTGTPTGYALRLLVDPASAAAASRPAGVRRQNLAVAN